MQVFVITQGVPTKGPTRSKKSSPGSQHALQERPRRAKERPRRSSERPKSHQERPKSAQEPLKFGFRTALATKWCPPGDPDRPASPRSRPTAAKDSPTGLGSSLQDRTATADQADRLEKTAGQLRSAARSTQLLGFSTATDKRSRSTNPCSNR